MGTVNSIAGNDGRTVTGHATLTGLNPIIMDIIHSRGYETAAAIDGYLHATLADVHSPFLFEGMHGAVSRIRQAIESGEQIGIFADSDLDGITSLAVLYKLLERMKITPFLRYLKDDENYGITRSIIDEFKDGGITLIITVDSGTRDVMEIAYARSLGIDVIVTDHHEPDRDLPDAILINPKLAASLYPFKSLAGVGVAFKLAHAILMSYLPSFGKLFLIIAGGSAKYSVTFIRNCIVEKTIRDIDGKGLENLIERTTTDDFILANDAAIAAQFRSRYPDKKIIEYIRFVAGIIGISTASIEDIRTSLSLKRKVFNDDCDLLTNLFMETQLAGSAKIRDYIESVIGLVAIGSIADVISLTEENRVLVRAGLEDLNRTRHPGLSMITNGEKIDSRFIGWTVAPLLNTPGRLGKTELTVDFFINNDMKKLRKVISEIKGLNEDRRLFVKEFCGEVQQQIDNGSLDSKGRLIHIKTDRIPEGYAGLIANRIADVYGKPVIVTVLPGRNGIVKGSGRSRSGTLFFTHFGKYSDRFDRIGGHENAFGFTVNEEMIDEIIGLVEAGMEADTVPENIIDPDYELDVGCINTRFINDLQVLEPYGVGNREPVFVARRLTFESFQQFGNGHGKYIISDYNPLVAIGWGMGSKMKDAFESGKPLDILFRLENNYYSGKVNPRMIVVDIKKTE